MEMVGSIHIAVGDDGDAFVSESSADRFLKLSIVARERDPDLDDAQTAGRAPSDLGQEPDPSAPAVTSASTTAC